MASIDPKSNTILGSKIVFFLSAEQKVGSKLILIKDAFNKMICSTKGLNSRLGIIKEIISRVKSDESIRGKVKKHKKACTYENAVEVCKDIVGFRIICMYEMDIFTIVDLIKKSGLKVVREKDYVTTSKPDTGYRSYHITVEVPIELPDGSVEKILVEIQIRTDFMDLWASREHDMKYKSKISKEDSIKINEVLKDLAGYIHVLQMKMEKARKKQLSIIEETEIIKVKGEKYKEKHSPAVVSSAESYVESELVLIKSLFELLPYSATQSNARLGDIKELLNREAINKNIDSRVLCSEFSSGSALKSKKDNVGFRIICMYEKDIFTIVDLIKKSGLNIIEEKDYVTKEKPSGYRSYHLTALVPVELPDGTVENVEVKIQIRTDFMDLWASREYEMKYNSELSEEELSSTAEALRKLSSSIQLAQEAMEGVRIEQLTILETANKEIGEQGHVKIKK